MDVISTDLIDRGFGTGGVNFLTDYKPNSIDRDIITNPPFKYAQDFIEKSLEVVTDNHKVAMFLRLQFLEGKARRKLFQTYPPQFVYVSSSRLCCAMNGDFERYASSNAVCFCWFVWQKGYHGDTILRWFN